MANTIKQALEMAKQLNVTILANDNGKNKFCCDSITGSVIADATIALHANNGEVQTRMAASEWMEVYQYYHVDTKDGVIHLFTTLAALNGWLANECYEQAIKAEEEKQQRALTREDDQDDYTPSEISDGEYCDNARSARQRREQFEEALAVPEYHYTSTPQQQIGGDGPIIGSTWSTAHDNLSKPGYISMGPLPSYQTYMEPQPDIDVLPEQPTIEQHLGIPPFSEAGKRASAEYLNELDDPQYLAELYDQSAPAQPAPKPDIKNKNQLKREACSLIALWIQSALEAGNMSTYQDMNALTDQERDFMTDYIRQEMYKLQARGTPPSERGEQPDDEPDFPLSLEYENLY